MKSFLKTGIVLVLISFTFRISAQEIKVTEFRSDPRDISARENVVYDANGDACALIKTRSGLQNLKFSCDLGIHKIENHDGEYWLWVSPNTRQINIEAEGIGKLQYKLPSFTEEYNVYVIFLTAILPDKILYQSINTFKIETNPSKAEVYINKAFLGHSPLNINIPDTSFKYKIRKKGWTSETGDFTYNEIRNELFIPLEKDPKANSVFLIASCGGNKFGTPFFGFQTGMIGKTGWYISYVPSVRAKECIVNIYPEYIDFLSQYSTWYILKLESFSKLIGESYNGYYFKLKNKNNTFMNHHRLKVGLTQRVFNNTYFLAGLGYARSTRYYRLDVIPYSNDPSLEVPLKKTYYGIGNDETKSLFIDAGFAFRISDRYLINLNISKGFWISEEGGYSFLLPFEVSFGVGYNFLKL